MMKWSVSMTRTSFRCSSAHLRSASEKHVVSLADEEVVGAVFQAAVG